MFGNGVVKFRDVPGHGVVAEINHENSMVRGEPVSLRSNNSVVYLLLRVGLLNMYTLYLYQIDPAVREDGLYNAVGITEFPATNLTAPKTAASMDEYLEKLAMKVGVAA